MKIMRFEDIISWQKSKELTLRIYRIFKNNRDFGFRDQIQRACVSIMNNIAEGFERKGNKEFKNFLFMAKGSSGEVRSMLYLASELGYVTKTEFTSSFSLTEEISRLLSGLIVTL